MFFSPPRSWTNALRVPTEKFPWGHCPSVSLSPTIPPPLDGSDAINPNLFLSSGRPIWRRRPKETPRNRRRRDWRTSPRPLQLGRVPRRGQNLALRHAPVRLRHSRRRERPCVANRRHGCRLGGGNEGNLGVGRRPGRKNGRKSILRSGRRDQGLLHRTSGRNQVRRQ